MWLQDDEQYTEDEKIEMRKKWKRNQKSEITLVNTFIWNSGTSTILP